MPSLLWNQVNFHAKKKQVISTRTHKQDQFYPRKKNKSISVLTLKPSQFLSPTQDQVNFDPKTEVKSILIPALKTSQFWMPPDSKTKFISI